MAKQVRTRFMRRKKVVLPGGRHKIHYVKRKPKKTKCAGCKKNLVGVPRALPKIIKRLSKSAKRPSRPYGGYYCSSCLRLLIRNKTRALEVKKK